MSPPCQTRDAYPETLRKFNRSILSLQAARGQKDACFQYYTQHEKCHCLHLLHLMKLGGLGYIFGFKNPAVNLIENGTGKSSPL